MSYIVIDCVHRDLVLPEYVEEIINTKQFQRLKNVKQLGESPAFICLAFLIDYLN